MARYLGPKAKLSRREATDLFLKSARRPIGDKAKFDSKPGQHGRTSGTRTSDYGMQLREKQKVKRMYGILERQFRRYFAEAERRRATPARTCCRCSSRGSTTSSTAWASARPAPRRASWSRTARSRSTARSSTSPRTRSRPATRSRVREKAKTQLRITDAMKLAEGQGLADWVQVDAAKLEGIFKKAPDRDEFGADIKEALIVELYSR